jgi:hypothetical protein
MIGCGVWKVVVMFSVSVTRVVVQFTVHCDGELKLVYCTVTRVMNSVSWNTI